MTIQLQMTLFLGSCFMFGLILRNIKKSKLSTELATVWIFWGIGLILISIFPQIISFIGVLIGVITPINTVYLLMIFLLYVLLFFLFLKVSTLEEKTKNLIHVVALMQKEKDDDSKN